MVERDLEEEFGAFGGVEKVQLIRKTNCAFIYMDSVDSASKAKLQLHDKLLLNMAIRVDFAKERGPGSPAQSQGASGKGHNALDPNSTRSLIIEGIDGTAAEVAVAAIARFAGYTGSKIDSKASRVFIDFKTAKDATAAKKAVSGQGYKMSYSKGRPSKKMWVGSVPANVSEGQLEKRFSEYGAVADLSIKRESKCAFVTMKEVKAAVAASEGLHGGEWGLKVEFVELGDKSSKDKANDKPVLIKKTVIVAGTSPEKPPAAASTAAVAEALIPLPKPKSGGDASSTKKGAGEQPASLAIPRPKPASTKSDE